MTDYKARSYYYRKIGPDAWIKSDHPHKTGVWLTQRAYDTQQHIEREQAKTARYTRRNTKRQLRSE